MDPFEAYIRDLQLIRSSGAGVKETSYYPPLANLLNGIGKTLKPTVRCIINIKNRGAGIPDGGLFTPDQFAHGQDEEPEESQNPARGVIEVKGTGDDAWVVADSAQVTKYYGKYRQVLVTNYRDFVLLAANEAGQPVKLESYRLAPNEVAFWAATSDPAAMVREHGERFIEYLTRVMLHAAPLASPQDIAWFLASYARDARVRIEQRADLPALHSVRAALEDALGLKFEGRKGEHFFRSTLVQTLFYGIFSAWILWSKEHPAADPPMTFNWRMAAWTLRVPMIRALFEQVATPANLGPLGLVEVLDWTGAALNRVDRAQFFARFEEDNAVQYFYEPFLKAFDPELRKDLGVWYTPREIVKYMVERVDTVLREELAIADGLADPRVYVLDPCCGTGAYLVEVLRRISATLAERGSDALIGDDIKRAALGRICGFELLPAPFVVAHLQLGLLLHELGAPLDDQTDERVAVYLTNALTGWEPGSAPKVLPFKELEQERDAAEEVKREAKILVILGNPPYNGFAGTRIGEERELGRAYRVAKSTKQPQGQGLNDLYVHFFRMAERRIAERTGRGIVCFISNYSWLNSLSCPAMRERYLEAFDCIWVDNLHGDRKISEYAPDGRTSETVFATGTHTPGIKVGTAITLMVRSDVRSRDHRLLYRDHNEAKAAERRAGLVRSLSDPDFPSAYTLLTPLADLGLPFKPTSVASDYSGWPCLPDLFPVSYPGVKTSRDDVVVDIDRDRLISRLMDYFDPSVSHKEMRQIAPSAMLSSGRFKAEKVRDQLRRRGFLIDNIVPYFYRPFDRRWLYWEPETDLLDRKRDDYFPQIFDGNIWLEARQKQPMERFDRGFPVRVMADNLGNGLSSYFPLYLRNDSVPALFEAVLPLSEQRTNLSQAARAYLNEIAAGAADLFFHILAVLQAPSYREENSGALRQDWPRVPLPVSAEALGESAALGHRLSALLDSDQAVAGVTTDAIRTELRTICVVERVGGGYLNASAGDLALRAGWGHAGKGGVTMPGTGRTIERAFTSEELGTMAAGAAMLELPADDLQRLLGGRTFDIYLNEIALWRNVPAKVWAYTIGGYPVIKKWLSYREYGLLGRSLTVQEVREVRDIARRIATILLLESALDANYQSVRQAQRPLPRS